MNSRICQLETHREAVTCSCEERAASRDAMRVLVSTLSASVSASAAELLFLPLLPAAAASADGAATIAGTGSCG